MKSGIKKSRMRLPWMTDLLRWESRLREEHGLIFPVIRSSLDPTGFVIDCRTVKDPSARTRLTIPRMPRGYLDETRRQDIAGHIARLEPWVSRRTGLLDVWVSYAQARAAEDWSCQIADPRHWVVWRSGHGFSVRLLPCVRRNGEWYSSDRRFPDFVITMGWREVDLDGNYTIHTDPMAGYPSESSLSESPAETYIKDVRIIQLRGLWLRAQVRYGKPGAKEALDQFRSGLDNS